METITSRQNPRIKHLVRLREKRERLAEGLFLIEGLRETRRALQSGINLVEIFLSLDAVGKPGPEALCHELAGAIPLTTLSAEVFQKVSLRDNPDGILAVARIPPTSLANLQLPASPLLLVVEQVEKPGNLGALIRSADAAGATALIAADPLVDFFNPQVIRNSQGAVFSLPCLTASSGEVLDFLRERDIRLIATTPDARDLLWDCPMTGAVAIAVGAESTGLSPLFLEQARTRLRIPMHGASDSLNVSVSAALCLYEAVRQRNIP